MKKSEDNYHVMQKTVSPGRAVFRAARGRNCARLVFPFFSMSFSSRAAILILLIVLLLMLTGCYNSLYVAAYRGDNTEVNEFLDMGANVNLEEKGHPALPTPLHGAAAGGHTATARILITKGADVNAKDIRGLTPLHWAIENGRTEMVRFLVEAGSDLKARSSRYGTPLEYAQRRHYTDIASILIEAEKEKPKSYAKPEPPSIQTSSRPAAPKVAAKDLLKIAVWDLMPREVKPTYAQELTSILVSEIGKIRKYEVYSQDNVRTLAGWTEERMKLGCTSTQCLTSLGQMDIAKLISGSVGRIGNTFSISLNLFDTQNAKAEKAVSEFCRTEDELIPLVQMSVRELLGEEFPQGKRVP